MGAAPALPPFAAVMERVELGRDRGSTCGAAARGLQRWAGMPLPSTPTALPGFCCFSLASRLCSTDHPPSHAPLAAGKYDKAVVEEEDIPLDRRGVAKAGEWPSHSHAVPFLLPAPAVSGAARIVRQHRHLLVRAWRRSFHCRAVATPRYAVDCRQDGCKEAA